MMLIQFRNTVILGMLLANGLVAACSAAPTSNAPVSGAVRSSSASLPAKSSSIPTPNVTPTPGASSVQDDGQNLLLSNPKFFWSLKLPRDWAITYDTGFEVKANNVPKTAFLHLLSQTWLLKDRLPNAKAYVDYWKKSKLGEVFPVYADGEQVAETEISSDKFGGSYLLYEFDDRKHSLRYLEMYASGGGPNSLLMAVWAKNADFEKLRAVLNNIIQSVELLK